MRRCESCSGAGRLASSLLVGAAASGAAYLVVNKYFAQIGRNARLGAIAGSGLLAGCTVLFLTRPLTGSALKAGLQELAAFRDRREPCPFLEKLEVGGETFRPGFDMPEDMSGAPHGQPRAEWLKWVRQQPGVSVALYEGGAANGLITLSFTDADRLLDHMWHETRLDGPRMIDLTKGENGWTVLAVGLEVEYLGEVVPHRAPLLDGGEDLTTKAGFQEKGPFKGKVVKSFSVGDQTFASGLDGEGGKSFKVRLVLGEESVVTTSVSLETAEALLTRIDREGEIWQDLALIAEGGPPKVRVFVRDCDDVYLDGSLGLAVD